MLIESVKALLTKPQFPRVLFLFGQEDFLVEETTDLMLSILRSRGVADVDIELLDGEELSLEHLVRRAEAYPMSSPERVIVVRHFERLPMSRKRSGEQALFEQYVTAPAPTTILLLQATEGRMIEELKGIAAALTNPKQRDKAVAKISSLKFPYKLLLEKAEWMEFPRLQERQIPEWIIKRFKAHKYECLLDAAQYLQMYVGSSLRDLANEIDKVMLYVGQRRRISVEDVLAVAGASRVYNIFELQKAVGLRDKTTALKVLHYMVRTERQELLIITMLARYFAVLWQLDELVRTTMNPAELGRAVGISPFFVQEYLAALKRYSTQQIEHALEALAQADQQLKRSAIDALTVLECTLLSIMEEKPITSAPLLQRSGAV